MKAVLPSWREVKGLLGHNLRVHISMWLTRSPDATGVLMPKVLWNRGKQKKELQAII